VLARGFGAGTIGLGIVPPVEGPCKVLGVVSNFGSPGRRHTAGPGEVGDTKLSADFTPPSSDFALVIASFIVSPGNFSMRGNALPTNCAPLVKPLVKRFSLIAISFIFMVVSSIGMVYLFLNVI
jgi:hypothetical protein